MMYTKNSSQVRDAVKNDLKNNVRIVSPDDFRNSLLSLEEDFRYELESVKNQFYGEERWSGFPEPQEKYPAESRIYGALVDIARAVNQACQMRVPRGTIKRDWINCHSKARSGVRPGIVQVSASTSADFQKVNENLCNSKARGDEIQILSSIWWTQIHTIIEVKPGRPARAKDLHETIIQVCSYILRVFREQFDRRFVMVMLLCGEELTLWYCDHVGLVGTIDPINIHEKPDEFLEILAAFSTLPASKLGWDPTMKIYRNGADAVPSYTILQNCQPSAFTWLVSMPSEENADLREEFITIRTLLSVDVHGICSRGSIVWEVMKKKDIKAGQCRYPVYVLKQAWQPIDDEAEEYHGVSEVKMYAIAGMLKDRIFSHEAVGVGNDIFSTESVRGNWGIQTYRTAVEELKHKLHITGKLSSVREGKAGRKRTLSNVHSEHYGVCSYMQLLNVEDNIFRVNGDTDHDTGNDETGLHSRVLVRFLMKKCGHPLRYFVDNFELVTVLRDVVQDHKNLYDKGILHRDISLGNIVICDDDDDSTGVAGLLIDLDHAKYSAPRITVPKHLITDEGMRRLQSSILQAQEDAGINVVDVDVLQKARSMFKAEYVTVSYLVDVSTTRRECFGTDKDATTVWTTNDLYWPDKLEAEIPDFGTRQGPEFTGTIPFMSAELMERICVKRGMIKPVHNAVHDMESLLWVLVYICLTRDSRNGCVWTIRPELQPGLETNLTALIRKLFKQDGKAKFYCLTTPTYFDDVLEHVHPYFNCLKPLLSKLRWTLYLAHKWQAVEYYNIHSIILAMLDETIVQLKQDRDESMALEGKRARRQDANEQRLALGQFLDMLEETEANYLPEYSPLSKVQSDAPMLDIPMAPPDSPTPGPKGTRG